MSSDYIAGETAPGDDAANQQPRPLSGILSTWVWVLGIWIVSLGLSALLAAITGVRDDAIEGDGSPAADGFAMAFAATLMCLPLFAVLYRFWRKPRLPLDDDPDRRRRILYLVAIVLTAMLAIGVTIAVAATVPIVGVVWFLAAPVALYVMRQKLNAAAGPVVLREPTPVSEPDLTPGPATTPMPPPPPSVSARPAPVATTSATRDSQSAQRQDLRQLISKGESQTLELKSTARWNLHAERQDKKIEHVITKTVCGFLNADGGTLLIGVDDEGRPVGLKHDLGTFKQGKQNRDHFELWLHQHLDADLSVSTAGLIRVQFETLDGSDVCVVEVSRSRQAIFARPLDGGAGKSTDFWVRSGNATNQLVGDDMVHYQSHHWGWWKRG